MRGYKFAAALAAGSIAISVPVQASAPMSEAESLRKLDVMLMVTGLRCRNGANNFMSDYSNFVTRHRATLGQANSELKAELARRYGARGATDRLDQLSVHMANTYGQGHPWLSCAQLKQVAQNLTNVTGRATLVEAANQVLAPRPTAQFAYAK